MPRDDDQFRQLVEGMRSVLIVLDSRGGDAMTALNMGLYIRHRGFQTAVADNAICGSGCAVVWLGGTTRFLGHHAYVGFHSVGRAHDAGPKTFFNKVVADYIVQLGYPEEFAQYAIKAPPKSVTWLTREDAQKYGIEIHALSELEPAYLPADIQLVPSK